MEEASEVGLEHLRAAVVGGHNVEQPPASLTTVPAEHTSDPQRALLPAREQQGRGTPKPHRKSCPGVGDRGGGDEALERGSLWARGRAERQGWGGPEDRRLGLTVHTPCEPNSGIHTSGVWGRLLGPLRETTRLVLDPRARGGHKSQGWPIGRPQPPGTVTGSGMGG